MKNLLNPEILALNLATLGHFGRHFVGRFFVPLLAVPLVAVGRSLYFYSKDLFYLPLLIAVIGILWIVSFAYENIPLERSHQIVLPLVPGMAEALLNLPLTPKIVPIAFLLFWFFNTLLDYFIEKLLQSDAQADKEENAQEILEDENDLDETHAYSLPPNSHKTIYEILMLPLGAGILSSFVIHIFLMLARRF